MYSSSTAGSGNEMNSTCTAKHDSESEQDPTSLPFTSAASNPTAADEWNDSDEDDKNEEMKKKKERERKRKRFVVTKMKRMKMMKKMKMKKKIRKRGSAAG
jgi:hypothetical protein